MPINTMLLQKNTFYICPELQDKSPILTSGNTSKSQSSSKYMRIGKFKLHPKLIYGLQDHLIIDKLYSFAS